MDDLFLLDHYYSDESKQIRNSVQHYVQHKILPHIAQNFESAQFPKQFIADAANLGLFGMTLPVEYGGSAASYLSYGLICQELEKGDSALRSCVSVQSSLCMYPIFRYGSEQQKHDYLPKMAQGELIACFGLTEAHSGSDPASMKTHAKKVKHGWQLNGSKMWITNAPIADLAIIWAKTEQGIRGFIVNMKTEGVQCSEIHMKMSLRASITGEISFNQVYIPDEQILPGTTQGLSCALTCLNQARYGIAWGAIGAAMACFEFTQDYVKMRQQFNQPLAAFQLIQNDLSHMYTEIIKAQLLNIQLGTLKDTRQDHHVMTSVAKGNACREALKIARNCRNILGANGISLEYPIIRHMLNLESVFTYEGTDNIHQLIIGRYLTGINAFT